MRVLSIVAPFVIALAARSTGGALFDQPASGKAAPERRAAKAALEPFNDWVGTWRGVGQPRRMSNKGAWTEEADWAWKIDRDSAGLELRITGGKLFQEGVLRYDPEAKRFRFTAKTAGGENRTYVGERGEQGKLVLVTADQDGSDQHRLTFQMLHADRLLMLAETRAAGQTGYARVAEIGYTRKGGSFASAGDSYPKCVVTGGRGTIAVDYKGKTYYVCCTGCKQAFLDDPEGTLAEAAQRVQKEKKK